MDDISQKKGKVAVFNPYFDSLGGGEVYTASVAELFLSRGFEVEIFWKDSEILEKIYTILGIDVRQASVNVFYHYLFSHRGNILKKWLALRKYQYSFFVSDGSIPTLSAKKNFLHMQVPYSRVRGKTIGNRIKLKAISEVIVNSNFTKDVIMKKYPIWPVVIYPPINVGTKIIQKQNIILSVGRFTTALHNKRQDVLIKAMRLLKKQVGGSWRLRLVGNTAEKEGKSIVKSLRNQSKNLPVDIITNISHQKLEEEYAKAKIYWHAAGYGVDESKFPEKVEHFGLSTAEAMSAGCIAIVIKKGGLTELVQEGKNGFLWNTVEELVHLTLEVIENDGLRDSIQLEAQKVSKYFSKARFFSDFEKLL